ncbi:MAG: glucokinase [Bacteroidetes bacterium GWF2_42_66]|nr:MAG: glucokinase [Bacteroidetes bacterium GWA2_42_15]OFX98476.1 MAG: glucokinase [Bacteroidetes bacterium GWE2_42_39]OFY42861.1 MAG: glucokinase [Bacteroidetes bacterium GWF2_42_66]HBL74490.1 glucokinase [Prolixibacteraceae bacterium]HCR89028.1 glucokinase [Prolixibacteraceae bacterium]
MKKVTIGVDIGGTNTAIGVVDAEGNVMVKNNIPTPSHGDINKYMTELSDAIKELIRSVNLLNADIEILGIGVGAPNGNYYNGTIEYAPNLSFRGVIHFVTLLKEKFPELPAIALTNDANAAAIGEMIYGGAKGMKNFVMYTLGTGVGSGIVVDGNMVYGHDGFAGECGHSMLIPGGRLCGCGTKGHLEAYCSAPGMKRTAFEIMARDNASTSLLADKSFNELDSKMIFDAAEKGDKVALEVFEQTGKWLGQGLADTVHHTSPEAIFLFGGPTAAGDYIFKPTIGSMNEYLLPIFKNKIKVLPSQLKAGDAAIVGASALVYKELEK